MVMKTQAAPLCANPAPADGWPSGAQPADGQFLWFQGEAHFANLATLQELTDEFCAASSSCYSSFK